MIKEIKTIVENYINNAKFCSMMLGEVTTQGIRISDKLVIPFELITGNLKKTVIPGDRVRLLRNHGGQQFYILEVLDDTGA